MSDIANSDNSPPRPELAQPGMLQMLLDAEECLFPASTPEEKIRPKRGKGKRREYPPITGQVWVLRQCAAPAPETPRERRRRGDADPPRCGMVFRVVVNPWGGGTEGKIYCCNECQQRAYRVRAKAKR